MSLSPRLLGVFAPGEIPGASPVWQSPPPGSRLLGLLRHGRVHAPGPKCFMGTTPLQLDSAGEAQARSWQPLFHASPPDRLLSSPLDRCRHTARLASPQRPGRILPGLSEIRLGAWEGQTFDSIRSRFPRAFEQRGQSPHTFRPPGGESLGDVAHRATSALIPALGKPSCRRVLAVTHAGVIRALLWRFLASRPRALFQFRPQYGSLLIFAIPDISMTPLT